MNYLTVYKSDYQKKRIGCSTSTHVNANNTIGDGGYIVADLDIYDALISCGIADDISFEEDFLKDIDIPCMAFDGTINSLPKHNNKITFIKKNISSENTCITTNLHEEMKPYNNIFLKMDIETYEFRWIHTLSKQQLKQIKQMVIEFHFPFTVSGFRHLDKELPILDKMDVFRKLAETHVLIHFHCNNCCGTTTYDNIITPNVFECTYVRKDIQSMSQLNDEPLPTPLDIKNTNNPDICLDWPPFVNKI